MNSSDHKKQLRARAREALNQLVRCNVAARSARRRRADPLDPSTDKKNLEYWAEGIMAACENNPPKMTTEPGRVAARIINEAITKIETTINSL
jgi:hypothetical protein